MAVNADTALKSSCDRIDLGVYELRVQGGGRESERPDW